MEVVPAIDLRGGRCVRLFQGDYNRMTIFSVRPVEVAARWQELGAGRLHVVDLDGAASGRVENWPALAEILEAVEIPVQFGGGVRDLATIDRLLDAGVQRVVLGSAAVEQPDLVEIACDRHPRSIVVSVDARDGIVAVHGWRDRAGVSADELLQQMAELGVRRFVCTDIARDGTLTGPNLQSLAHMVGLKVGAIIASGGVSTLDHLVQLQAAGLEAAIVGKALYVGTIDLPEALETLARACVPC
ncbi:MAG: 1-(5-phosphoribosyl)-5-[(5-phosphoribosylamino)methylideneamino]imidazole-4-carboxamide isomerase [Chloroflexi bacterium]|nr:1-(5-phosphoribosyl)-5-[(5-phosphoribosylamino)methylideneamino]imidazole-4-carboxamide isomerase [Chloroflexota bacterium]